MKKNYFLLLALTICHAGWSQNQTGKNEVAVLFGLNQPIVLSGFNVEVNYFTRKIAFDVSHGISLEFQGSMVPDEMQAQHLVAHLPYSTGFGIGYRLTRFFNLRVEPKWHRFDLYYDGEEQTSTSRVATYNTFTLGLGLYGKWMPFEKKQGFIRNVMIAPSLRYWPNVSTSLENDALTYQNKMTGKTETHHALNIGAANTPWLVNISVGYRFQ